MIKNNININDKIKVYTEDGYLIDELTWHITYIDTRYKKIYYEAQSDDGLRDIKQMERYEFEVIE